MINALTKIYKIIYEHKAGRESRQASQKREASSFNLKDEKNSPGGRCVANMKALKEKDIGYEKIIEV